MAYEKITLTVQDSIAVLRLNDPDALNAFTFQMAEEMAHAVAAAEEQAAVLVIGANGRAFCSGANLGESADAALAGSLDAGGILESHLNLLMTQLRDLNIPWIAAVNGPAVGAGSALALAADLVLASESSYFLQAFVHVGLMPDSGTHYLLARTIGRVRAMELMLLGDKITSQQACDWGLVTSVCPADQLDQEALNLANRLAAGPSLAMTKIRQAVWQSLDLSWSDMLALERDGQKELGFNADFREGVSAFLEKRRPDFSGS